MTETRPPTQQSTGNEKHPSISRAALKIASYYVILGVLWILLSDYVVSALVQDPQWITHFQTFKGIAYVVTTATVLYLLLRHEFLALLKTKENLYETEQRLRLAVEHSKTGLWDRGLETNQVYFSPQWKAQLGYENHEIQNRFEEWEIRVHPEDRERVLSKVRAHLENPAGDYGVDFRMRHRDGSYRWILTQASALRDRHGKPYRMLGSHIDITERKLAQEQMQLSLDRLRILSDIERAITLTLDLPTLYRILLEKILELLPYGAVTIRLLNRASGRLERTASLNFDEETWKTRPEKAGALLGTTVVETKAPVMVANARSDPRTKDSEFFLSHGFISYLGVPLLAKGEILGVLSFYTNEEHVFSQGEIAFLMTLGGQAATAIHNAQLYEQVKNQAIELEKANRVKDEFLGIMSHELRTPLNVIVGYAGMLHDGLLGTINPGQENALGKIRNRSQDLLNMVGGILEATRIKVEGASLEKGRVNLSDFINGLRERHEFPLGKEVSLEWDFPSDLPTIETDADKLTHIAQNLVENAIKFTEQGKITVSARSNPQNCRIELRVTDTGIGIAEEDLPKIFDMFRQIDSSETRPYGGIGLGLYIVKKFTGMLGGEICVESTLGEGSTFTVTLPLIPP